MGQNLAEWVEHQEARAHGDDYPEERNDERRVTVRIGLGTYLRIQLLAARYGFSTSAMAAQFLTLAAGEAFDLSSLSDSDLNDAIAAEI